ncbi:MAG: gluconate 2-dehydrogenase subunit 3 family protein [Gemmatimonadota bacterium]|jgi:gluconate 2-dehydrogenase gamma chain
MPPSHPDRRTFLNHSGMALGGAWLLGLTPALEAAGVHARRALAEGLPFAVLSPREARDLEAVSAVMIPSDDTPGAREAGVVHFVDRSLETVFPELVPPVRGWLAGLQDYVRENHDGLDGFADLSEATQADVLRDMEAAGGAFGLVRILVMFGMFSHPEHGGNRGEVGWRLLGYEPAPAYQPPFGYYDAVDREG